MENDLVDLQAADVSDLRWEQLVEELTGPDNFINQCESCATTYGSCNGDCVAPNPAVTEQPAS